MLHVLMTDHMLSNEIYGSSIKVSPEPLALALGTWFPYVDGGLLPKQPALTSSKAPSLVGTNNTLSPLARYTVMSSVDTMERLSHFANMIYASAQTFFT